MNIPNLAQNHVLTPAEHDLLLDSYGYMPSKEYARPLVQGLTAKRAFIWTGFPNVVRMFLQSNAQRVNVPRAAVKGWSHNGNLNAPAIGASTGSPFAGAAPTRAIYTGVGD